MQLKLAEISDIDGILKLHTKYQINTIAQEDKKDGFVTTPFTKELLEEIIKTEQGVSIAKNGDEIVAYVFAASWQYWSRWEMFRFMIGDLKNLKYLNQTITTDNSYQYGPVCIDKNFRGSGLLEKLFDFSLEFMSKKYPILITFVNKINPRSYQAHKRKLGLDLIWEFEFNGNSYYEFAFDTSKRVLRR